MEVALRYEVAQIGDGWRGTDETVGQIRRLVDEALLDPIVVRTARSIVRNVAERDKDGEIRAVSDFIRSKVRYVHEGVETLSTPRLMLEDIAKHGKASGDCDEFVTLWAALLRSLGHPVRVMTISQRKDGLANHIFGQVWSPAQKRWITDDAIMKRKPLGWSPPKSNVTNHKAYSMNSNMDGLGGLGHCGCEKEKKMSSLNDWIQLGRTPIVRSDRLAPKKRAMVSRSLAPTSAVMKRPGMLYVSRDGSRLEGATLGQFEAIASALSPILSKVTEAAGKVYESKILVKGQEALARLSLPKQDAPMTATVAQQQQPAAAGGGFNPLMLLPLLFLLKR